MQARMAAGLMLLVAASACNDTLGLGNATEEEREDIIAELDASGFFGEAFGDDGIPASASVVTYGYGDAGDAPFRWGRRHGPPVSREINVVVEEGIATVTRTLEFEGTFLVSNPDTDGVVSKPANETMTQRAVLVRRDEAVTDEHTGRIKRWRLVELSPQEWFMTREDARTVDIERVEIVVNGESAIVIEDPAMLFDVATELPHLTVGDEVRVTARVKNYTGEHPEGDADTYVFLHLFHVSTDRHKWMRVPMEFDPETGMYTKGWIVRHEGRERIVVDAIDADAFALDREDSYRANLWALPYRVEDDVAN